MSVAENGVLQPCTSDSEIYNVIPWHIVAFPAEVLGSIGSWSGLVAVTKLFRSGSSLLRSKLSSPDCHLELRFTSYGTKFWNQLPPLLSELKGINGVSFDSTGPSAFLPPIDTLNWSILPTTLQHFHCMMQWPKSAVRFLAKCPFPNLVSVSLQVVGKRTSDTDLPIEELVTVLNGFPQLRHLELSSLASIEFSAFYELPIQLESLKLVNLMGTLPIESIIRLRKLKKLILPHFSRISFPRPSLPVHEALTVLYIPHCRLLAEEVEDDDSMVHLSHFVGRIIISFPAVSQLSIHANLVDSFVDYTVNGECPAFWNNLTTLEVNGRLSKAFPIPPRLLALKIETPNLEYPERLPRTLLSLSLPQSRLPGRKLSQLPPKLSKLLLAPEKIDYSDGTERGLIETLPLPSSLTLLESASEAAFNLTESELILLSKLPDTVLVLQERHVSVRVPEHLILPNNAGCHRNSKFSTLSTALFANHHRLADYIAQNWIEVMPGRFSLTILENFAQNRSLETVSWFSDKIRRFRPDLIFELIERPDSITSLLLASSSPVPLLEAYLKGGIPGKIFKSPSFLIQVIKKGNMALLERLVKLGTDGWDVPFEGATVLSQALDFNISSEMLDFLLQHGMLSVSINFTLSKCLEKATLKPLEQLKDLSKQWQLSFIEMPDNSISTAFWKAKDPFFFLEILEWMTNPKHGLNVPIKRRWLAFVFSWFFHLFVGSVRTKFHGYQDTIVAPIPTPFEMDHTWDLFAEALLAAPSANHAQTDFNPDKILQVCKLFVGYGVDIFSALHYTNKHTLVDVALILNSLELLTFLSTIPGPGFINALMNNSKSETCPNWLTPTIMTLAVQPKLTIWKCSQEICAFVHSICAKAIELDSESIHNYNRRQMGIDLRITTNISDKKSKEKKELFKTGDALSEGLSMIQISDESNDENPISPNSSETTLENDKSSIKSTFEEHFIQSDACASSSTSQKSSSSGLGVQTEADGSDKSQSENITTFGKSAVGKAGISFGGKLGPSAFRMPVLKPDGGKETKQTPDTSKAPSKNYSPTGFGKGGTFGKTSTTFGSGSFKSPSTKPDSSNTTKTSLDTPKSPTSPTSPTTFGTGGTFAFGKGFGSKTTSEKP